jgi:hypothetical protein
MDHPTIAPTVHYRRLKINFGIMAQTTKKQGAQQTSNDRGHNFHYAKYRPQHSIALTLLMHRVVKGVYVTYTPLEYRTWYKYSMFFLPNIFEEVVDDQNEVVDVSQLCVHSYSLSFFYTIYEAQHDRLVEGKIPRQPLE